MGKVFSYLGQPDRAVAEGQRAIDLLPISKNSLEGSQWVEALAEIQSQLGHADAAFALLKQLLDMPAGDAMSVWALKLDPVWDPLRADPRFQNLIAQASAQKPNEPTRWIELSELNVKNQRARALISSVDRASPSLDVSSAAEPHFVSASHSAERMQMPLRARSACW